MPRYNGGLFNPDLHPFLVDYYVGDGHLAQAINVLARREVADGKKAYRWENVDYRTLGVRQIGSIYEGLLEYKPRRATRDLVAVRQGKTETWVPVAEKPKKVSNSRR